jgi:hypothetical protein
MNRQVDPPREVRIAKYLHTTGKVILVLSLVCVGLSSCKPATDLPQIVDFPDLREALQNAGVDVKEGEGTSSDFFEVPGRVLFWDDHEIEVYEFSSEREAGVVSEDLSTSGTAFDGKAMSLEDKPSIWVSGHLVVVYHGFEGGIVLLLSGLMGDPITYEAPAEDEPFPPAIVAAIRYLAETLAVEPGSIQVLDFKMVEWPDSCLGAAEMEEVCDMRITYGWQVTMKVHGEVYELRTDEMGEQIRQP